ncbi:MAG: transposase, partial [Desulfovibrio sp.]|nr:transposase [Desulfovibrio sp.]
MDAYQHGTHSVFSIHLHSVWITKYRKPVLAGVLSLKHVIRQICASLDVEIIRGH